MNLSTVSSTSPRKHSWGPRLDWSLGAFGRELGVCIWGHLERGAPGSGWRSSPQDQLLPADLTSVNWGPPLASVPLRLSVSMAQAVPRGPGLWSLDDGGGRGVTWGERNLSRARSRRGLTLRAACPSVVLHPHEYHPSFLLLTCHTCVQCPWMPSLWWSSVFCLQRWS